MLDMKILRTICITLGICFIVSAISVGWIVLPYAINGRIRQEICLKEGGETFERWQFIPVPIYMKVFLFNVTNPADVLKGHKPILNEVGPYVYAEKREKLVENVSLENDTVLFRPKITYTFFREMSVGSEDDVYTFINIPLVSIIKQTKHADTTKKYLLKMLMEETNEELFVRKRVGDFLFHGYRVPIVEQLSIMRGANILPNNSFSMYGAKNGTAGDLLEIYSGVRDNTKFGWTISWNGNKKISTWDDSYCNMINGSDGSIFPPFVTRDRVLRIFSPDMCRSMYMTYKEDTEILGIKGYRFTTPRDVMANPRDNPNNQCYCKDPGENFEGCPQGGTFELSHCNGAPIAASWPHFYEGAEEYFNQSIGLNPNRDIHETFIVLEPHTGSLLRASKRFQVNAELQRVKYFNQFRKVPTMLFPVLWVDESAGVDETTAEILHGKLFRPLSLASHVVWGVIAVGSTIVFVTLLIHLTSHGKQEKP